MDNDTHLEYLYEQRRDLIRRLNTVEEQITKRLIHADVPPSPNPEKLNPGKLVWRNNTTIDLTGDAA